MKGIILAGYQGGMTIISLSPTLKTALDRWKAEETFHIGMIKWYSKKYS